MSGLVASLEQAYFSIDDEVETLGILWLLVDEHLFLDFGKIHGLAEVVDC